MSEYQYFEFLAIDRPLRKQELDHLRSISTRAHITPFSFVNEYHWSGLKADPLDLMRDYFDVHVYCADWGEFTLMVRLPQHAIDSDTLKAFSTAPYLEFEKSRDNYVVFWSLGETENYDRFASDQGSGWMARLAPLREELLRGDIRSLYIGWLRGVTTGDTGPDAQEPRAVDGLGQLTDAQRALAEFVEVDTDLLTGAAQGTAAIPETPYDEGSLDAWLNELPETDIHAYLKQVLQGAETRIGRELQRKYMTWLKTTTSVQAGIRRGVAELWSLAEHAKSQRLRKQANVRRRAERKRKQEREAELRTLSSDFPRAWRSVRQNAEKGHARAYDLACQQLVDLREAYLLIGELPTFQTQLQRFVKKYSRRSALVSRLAEAKLWQAS